MFLCAKFLLFPHEMCKFAAIFPHKMCKTSKYYVQNCNSKTNSMEE